MIRNVQLDPDAPSDGFLDGHGLSVLGDSALVLSGFTNVIDNKFTLRIDTALTSPQLLLHDRTPGEWIEDQVIHSNGNILQASFAASPITGICLLIRRLASDGTSNCPNIPCTASLSTASLASDLTLVQNPATPIVSDVTTLFPISSITLLNMPACLSTATSTLAPLANVHLMPNPASKEVPITGTDLQQIPILDATGRLVRDRRAYATDMFAIGLDGLPNGLLMVRVRTATGWSTHRLVKDQGLSASITLEADDPFHPAR